MNATDCLMSFGAVPELSRWSVIRFTSCLKRSLAPGLALVVVVLPGAFAQVSQVNVQHSDPGTIKQATGAGNMHLPGAIGFEYFTGAAVQRRIMMPWSTNADYTPASSDWALSTNGGDTFGSTQTTPNLPHRSLIKQRTTGALLTYDFGWTGSHSSSQSSFNWTYHKSTDGGSTWVPMSAVVNFPSATASTHFHRDILEENDGSLYAIGYAKILLSERWREVMMKSTDGGATWNYLSTIASSSIRDYTEASLARCADGSWLVVMKADGADEYLRYMRSTDKGLTWTGGAATLPGLPNAFGVDPALRLMPNGILVLSWGPPNAHPAGSRDLHIAVSSDGNGANWSHETTVLTSTWWNPSAPYSPTPQMCETSGYSAVPAVSAHRFLHLSDTGHSWSYENTIPSPNPFSIQGKYVDIVRTAEINRLDLKTKLAAGAITLSTDLTYTDANNQESRASAAVDGSTDYWSGAFKNATSGFYTIDLQQNHTINKIGVCLHYNTPESATIQRSTDGVAWTTIKTYTNATHRALDYTAFTAFTARYIRVNVNAAAAPVCLNEIEIYVTKDTFENNAVGIPGNPHGILPPGYVANGTSGTQYGFAVRDAGTSAGGYQSERSFQMWDGSSTWRAGIKKSVTAGAAKTLEFGIKPLAYSASGGAIQFLLSSGTAAVFQMAVFPDGSIKYYNGSAWVATTGTGSPAGAGTVPLNTWSVIKVVASASTGTAVLTVDGVAQGNAAKVGTATTMDAFSFGSGGTAPAGDNALFDDISIL